MAIFSEVITDRYALYHGDGMEVLANLPDESIPFSLYSPPFAGLYHYSSSDQDLSNCASYEEFMAHYEFFVKDLSRVTWPGRMSGVHCMDIPSGNTGKDHLLDFPGDIIRLHAKHGFRYTGRYHVWKEPLAVRLRTMMKGLEHRTIVEDSSRCSVASADYLLMFRKDGVNSVPIQHPTGFEEYAGARQIPEELLKFKNWKGKQTENRYSHWIWRRYADAFWDDIRLDNVLPFKGARDSEDERHVHPLQLDVIARAVTLWTNPGETVCSPFGGVGSEGYEAVRLGRKAIMAELKASYFRQMVKNMEAVDIPRAAQVTMQFDDADAIVIGKAA